MIGKVHSARMREIDRLLSTQREEESEVFVDTRSEARTSVCPLAPPKTIVNRFAGLVPRLNLDPVFGKEVREVFLTHLPANEHLSVPATERVLGSTVRNSTLLRAVKPSNSFMRPATIKLAPLRGTDVSTDRTVAALVTSRVDPDRLGACLISISPALLEILSCFIVGELCL